METREDACFGTVSGGGPKKCKASAKPRQNSDIELSARHRNSQSNSIVDNLRLRHTKLPTRLYYIEVSRIRNPKSKMDLGNNIGANVDLSKLSDRDKQELQQFVMNESQKARIQACTSSLLSFVLRIRYSP